MEGPLMATELATAYVNILPSTRGLGKAIVKDLGSAQAGVSQVGESMGSRLSSGIGRTLKRGAAVTGAAVAGVLGTAVVKGFSRLSAIENAEAKLKGLGNSAGDVQQIMSDALASVKGTAFGMDEAATTAASAVAAGIKPGKDLAGYLGLVGDAATIGGTSLSEMGSIFNKVATSGKVQGDVFAQLGDIGIPVVQLLAEELGVAAADVYKLGADGKISSEQFLTAMSSMQGAALESGNTTTGAFKNMGAALARLGAGLLKGVYPAIGPVFNAITAGLDKAEAYLTPVAEALSVKIGGALKTAGEAAVRFLTPLRDIGNLDVLTPDIVKRMGLSADSPLGRGMTELIGGIRAFAAAWEYNDGVVTSSGFPGFMERAAYGIRQTWDALRALDFSSWEAFKTSLGTSGAQIGAAFTSIGDSLVTLKPAMGAFLSALPEIGGSVGTLAVAGITALASTLSFLAEHVDTIVRFMPLIVAGFVAWRVASMALAASSQRLQWAQLAMAPVLLANNVLRLTNILLENRQTKATLTNAAATSTNTTATAANNTAQRVGLITRLRAVAAMVAHRAAMLASLAAIGLVTAAQWAWNVALNANPLGLIVIGIVAVVAAIAGLVYGIKWAYNNFDWFKNAVDAVWTWIKSVTASVIDWITGTAFPAVRAGLEKLGAAMAWFKETIIEPVWVGIRFVFALVVGTIIGLFILLKDAITWLLAPVFEWFRDKVIRPVMSGVRSAIDFVVSWFRDSAVPAFRNAVQWVADKFNWFRDNVIRPVFDWVRSKIDGFMFWYVHVFGVAVRNAVQWVADKFLWFRDNVIRPVFDWVKAKLEAFWHWYVNVFGAAIRRAIQWVADKFLWFRDNVIRPVWDWIRDKITGAWDSIKSRAFDPLTKSITETIPDAFERGKNAVKKQWDKLKEIISKPVGWVIDNVINEPLISSINSVLESVGLADKKIKPLPATGFARGGWTGPGGKYDPAGIVHADEYVIRKESQRDISRTAPGLLDAMNRYGASALGYARGGLVKPVNGVLMSGFGPRAGGFHDGVDFAAPHGTPVVAAKGGTVQRASWSSHGGGNQVEIRHPDGLVSWYAHLSSFAKRVGDMVNAGDMIGRVGSTGNSSGPHLHFAVYQGGWTPDFSSARNPLDFLAGAVKGDGSGGGLFGLLDPVFSIVTGITDKIRDKFPGGGAAVDMILGAAKTVAGGAKDWVTGLITGVTDSITRGVSNVIGAGKASWYLAKALRHTGDFSVGNMASGMRRMQQESGFDVGAVNNWDTNAAAGDPSRGLMQVIGSTFRAYRDPSLSADIFDPLANIVAAIRYTKSRYGSLRAGWDRSGGYAEGGLVRPALYDRGGLLHKGVQVIDHQRRSPDRVLTDRQWNALYSTAEAVRASDTRPTVNVVVPEREGVSPDQFGRRIGDAAAWEMMKAGI